MRVFPSCLRVLLSAFALVCLVAAPAGAAEPKISLNFVNADIGEVLKAIGQVTGKTFIVDPRVKGTLNIASPQPVSKSVAYDILLSSMRLQGYAAVESNGVVRIVPEADAKFYALPYTGKSKRGKGLAQGQMVSRVFPLHHESAAQMVVVLRPLVSPNNVISADTSSNSLLVTDYADNVARLEEILANLDVPDVGEPVIIPLRYASAQEVAGLINRVFTSQPTAPGDPQRVDIAVDNRSNSLVVQSNNPSKLARVHALLAKLDVPTPVAGNVHVIYLKNAQAEKVALTLRNILNADTGSLQPNQPTSAPAATGQKTASGGTPDMGPGMVQADTASNALIITAPDAVFSNIKAVVEKLDVRRAQVLVEALIVEVSADKAAEFGIQWLGAGSADGIVNGGKVFGIFGNSNTNTNIGTIAAAAVSNSAGAAAGIATGLNLGLFKDKNLGVLARALETNANANILSTPTLLTLDNEEAKISIGSTVPFLTGQYSVTGSSATANPFSTYERKDVGLTLKVKPRISEGGTINLAISQEVSKLRQAADPTLSATDKRSIDSNVLVDDGQIVVLGGLIEEQVQDTEDKVPLLGDIPGLGNLFRYNTRKHVKTNLMVFLRPVIVRDKETAADVTHARYDYILGVQEKATPRHKVLLPDIPPLTMDRAFGAGHAQPDAAP
ncbi:MAG: type II secretion system secretin GspD [Gallionellaceae bacterium]|nr:type II secretion system secretin GspD [Gallionellaceae bacterium]